MLSKKQGDFLVKEARKTIESFVYGKKYEISSNENWLNGKRGIFTTIHSYPGNELRGCVGFSAPFFPIRTALVESARSACMDERFPLLEKEELSKILIEVSVLTLPEEMNFKKPEELVEKLTCKEGLIIKMGHCTGLFLPQVWEQLPNKKEFLDHLCLKACLPPGAWKRPEAKILSFRAQIFREDKPGEKIFEEK